LTTRQKLDASAGLEDDAFGARGDAAMVRTPVVRRQVALNERAHAAIIGTVADDEVNRPSSEDNGGAVKVRDASNRSVQVNVERGVVCELDGLTKQVLFRGNHTIWVLASTDPQPATYAGDETSRRWRSVRKDAAIRVDDLARRKVFVTRLVDVLNRVAHRDESACRKPLGWRDAP
jgi:hypothetical protein